MGHKPLSDAAIAVLQRLDPRSKALLLTDLALNGKDARSHYATNMMFAPAGFSPDDIVPGIIAANNCGEWMNEVINDGIDIDFEAHLLECESYQETDTCECEWEQGTTLLGDWHQVAEWRHGNRVVKPHTKGSKRHWIWEAYRDDHEGASGFAATWSPNTYDITVEWSKWVYRGGRWCSPCAIGQASIPHGGESFDPDTDGVVCYILPADLHLCFSCGTFGRETVWAPGYYGAVLCDVCCEKYGIDFMTGEGK